MQNPMLGTEFESLEFSEPQLFANHRAATPKRVLVLGAGISGAEAARMAAGRGHTVEIWESAERAGGQIDLATAAPDKMEVEPVWSYRTAGTRDTGRADAYRGHGYGGQDPKFRAGLGDRCHRRIAATRALRCFATLALSWRSITPGKCCANQNWFDRERVSPSVGGGMVGLETADLLVTRQCAVTVIEMLAAVALGMARNNRMELIDRLNAAGVVVHLETRIVEVHDTVLEVCGKDETRHDLSCGEVLILRQRSETESAGGCHGRSSGSALHSDRRLPAAR